MRIMPTDVGDNNCMQNKGVYKLSAET